MPSRARCRRYLRSRLTSAARIPRARAPPWDLARPLRPHSLTAPRDTAPQALPCRRLPKKTWPAGVERAGCRGIYSSRRLEHPLPRWPPTPRDGNPGADLANIQTQTQTWAETQALYPDTRSHHIDPHMHAIQVHTYPEQGTDPSHMRWGRKKSPDPGREAPTGPLPSSPTPISPDTRGLESDIVPCAHTRARDGDTRSRRGWAEEPSVSEIP